MLGKKNIATGWYMGGKYRLYRLVKVLFPSSGILPHDSSLSTWLMYPLAFFYEGLSSLTS
jgi:hypothetical protein